MCGIIGYIGSRPAVPIIIEGLKKMEYRGYDSAGIAILNEDKFIVRRAQGKIRDLEKLIEGEEIPFTVGVGHTRWATHGVPSEENAHPHRDDEGRIVVVQNGIIENFLALKEQLRKRGHVFTSQTDTEVIPHLIAEHFEGDLPSAVRKAIAELKGAFALVVASWEDPRLVAVRMGPPMIVGKTNGDQNSGTGGIAASDIAAILEHTRDVFFLDDGEIAVLDGEKIELTDFDGNTIEKSTVHITWNPIQAQKGGYRHFMLKEIFQQPESIRDTIMGRFNLEEGNVILDELSDALCGNYEKFDYVLLTACGTAWHACLVGKYMIEGFSDLRCEVDYGSELRYRDPKINDRTLVIAISQSGETADTLAAIRRAKQSGATVVSIVNVVGSTVARESDAVIYTHCGPEIGVASTKAFTSQLAVLVLLSLHIGRKTGRVTADECRFVLQDLIEIPQHVMTVLRQDDVMSEFSSHYKSKQDFLYLGRGINYPIALEGALKLKEISYIHAEGYPAGEMKHGPIALISSDMPVVTLVTRNKVYEKTLTNLMEVKARGGEVIAIADEGDEEIGDVADHVFYVPKVSEVLSPILLTVPLQLLAYHIA
ncbi:MAG TPA: glutamine--fructose-6-phosphate transaminase (isomerizing), partial [Firmicutes bacterium]|nr:glutamine--fructose-6-phosphate transaminase (isomerizing) [Bacillota bacterium]